MVVGEPIPGERAGGGYSDSLTRTARVGRIEGIGSGWINLSPLNHVHLPTFTQDDRRLDVTPLRSEVLQMPSCGIPCSDIKEKVNFSNLHNS